MYVIILIINLNNLNYFFIFSFSEVNDAYSQGFRAGKQKYVSLTKNIEEARRQIAEAELDILYFTDIGMEPLTYFLGFSRLAPIQCVTWGTSGYYRFTQYRLFYFQCSH